MKRVFSLAVALMSLSPAMTWANEDSRSTSFQPCSWWSYESSSGNYGCRSVGMTTYMYDSREVDRLVQQLERKISDLEARVRVLEQKP